MQVPVELVVWMLGANGVFLSFCVHLLIRINGKIGTICTTHEVAQVETLARIKALERHEKANELEIAGMRRHLGHNPSPRHQPIGT